MATICLMVRTEYLAQKGKRPRGVSFPITTLQKEARDSMLQALLSDPPIADDILIQNLHQLCSSILMVNLSNAPKLGFAFELALCIYSYHHFLNASQVSQLFAGMQSCFRLTLAHIIRLESQGEKTYTDPPISPPPDQENTVTHSQSIGGDSIQEDYCDGDVMFDGAEWPDIGLDDEVEVLEDDTALGTSTKEGNPVSDSLLRLEP